MLFNDGSIEIFGGVNVNRNPPQKIKFSIPVYKINILVFHMYRFRYCQNFHVGANQPNLWQGTQSSYNTQPCGQRKLLVNVIHIC